MTWDLEAPGLEFPDDGLGFVNVNFSRIEAAASYELAELGYPATLDSLIAVGALVDEYAPLKAREPNGSGWDESRKLFGLHAQSGLPPRTRRLIQVIVSVQWVRCLVAENATPAAAVIAFDLGVTAALCGLAPEIEKAHQATAWQRAGSAAANGDRTGDWTAWQQTLNELNRDYPTLSYRKMRLQAAQKHGVSERIIKKRCQNPKK